MGIDRETQTSFPKLMLIKPLAVVAVSCLIWIASWVFTPSAIALTQIKLYDLSYHDCPPELAEGTVTSGSAVAANCFLVTGKAENSSGKPVVNADIFGRIYDADGNGSGAKVDIAVLTGVNTLSTSDFIIV